MSTKLIFIEKISSKDTKVLFGFHKGLFGFHKSGDLLSQLTEKQ